MSNFRFNVLQQPQPRHNGAIEKLNQLQADLVSEALTRAVDDMGAAMAHQLRDPLTSLLLYLHEIKRAAAQPENREVASSAMQEFVEMALRETERVCEIMERVGHIVDAPTDVQTVGRGREAIESWSGWTGSNGRGAGYVSPPPPYTGQDLLTPREREVLALIAGGCSNKGGGHRLGISTRTFEAHRAHLMAKLGAKNVADLVRIAMSDPR